MKTQNKKLVFGKNTIIELNDQQSMTINGGTDTILGEDPTGYVCSNCVTHTAQSIQKPTNSQ